ncbi:MAG TPA: LapA family protein [Spirochaetia bacterium]|nr:LapA family protein [Spirochaetia bacterium]
MGRIVVSVVLLLILVVVIVMNLGPTTTVNLFGAQFQKVPLIAVAMLSFALGVVYSFFLYIGHYLHRTSRDRLAKRHRDVEERERKLAASQVETGGKMEPADQVPAAGPGENPPAASEHGERGSALSRFFRLFR